MDPVPIVVIVAVVALIGAGAFVMWRRRAAKPVVPTFRSSADVADRTFVGLGPRPADDRTIVGTAPPRADDARTMVGLGTPPSRGDRTAVGVPPEPAAVPAADAGPATARTIVVPRGPRARLVLTKGGSGGPFELAEKEHVLGRSSAADIHVDDPSVSGRHASLSPRGDGFVLRDLGSTNGTLVNGAKVEGERVLVGGETVQLGEALLRYERLR